MSCTPFKIRVPPRIFAQCASFQSCTNRTSLQRVKADNPSKWLSLSGTGFQPVTGVSTFSGVGSLDQVCSVVLDGELLKQFRVFGNFFAQQGDEIEARRALGITPPFG